jgi:microcompartment protein CcmK/EutM
MLLGRVIGNVWATRKEESLEGLRLMVVRAVDLDLKPLKNFVIAVDTVSAGVGELVLVAQGSSARQTASTQGKPVDAVIMTIVENFDLQTIEELKKDFEERNKEVDAKIQALSET